MKFFTRCGEHQRSFGQDGIQSSPMKERRTRRKNERDRQEDKGQQRTRWLSLVSNHKTHTSTAITSTATTTTTTHLFSRPSSLSLMFKFPYEGFVASNTIREIDKLQSDDARQRQAEKTSRVRVYTMSRVSPVRITAIPPPITNTITPSQQIRHALRMRVLVRD